MRQIVADANALIAPFKLKFNIDSELTRLLGVYEIIVPKPIVGELEKLAVTNTHARGALKLAKSRIIKPTKSAGDDAVLELAKKIDGFVMTNDKELIARARKRNLKIIRVKEGGKLAPDEGWMLD
ncbi:MAG: twitching motility protein PilT [Thermoplasmata archaeon]|nr:twitching motility protein PilT [Thermoplasmata archaeon]